MWGAYLGAFLLPISMSLPIYHPEMAARADKKWGKIGISWHLVSIGLSDRGQGKRLAPGTFPPRRSAQVVARSPDRVSNACGVRPRLILFVVDH
jgi:hypothetical protein